MLLSALGDRVDEELHTLLETELDWPLIHEVAIREGAAAPLRRRIEALGMDIPVAAHRRLWGASMLEEFRMSRLEDRLVELLGMMNRRDIDVVLLKGAALALGAEHGLRTRPMGDVDLLVRPEHADAVHELARDGPWIPIAGGYNEAMYEGMHHLIPLHASDGTGVRLEIHTDIFPDWTPFAFSATDVWREVRRLDAYPPAHVPALAHQFLHTALHFAWSHRFQRGVWKMLHDMERFLSDPEFDSVAIQELARSSRGVTCVYWTLRLMQELTGRSPPTALMDGLTPPKPCGFQRLVLRQLSYEGLAPRAAPGTRLISRTIWNWAIQPEASGHGARRPLPGDDHWPVAPEPEAGDQAQPPAPGGWVSRLRGSLAHGARVLGLTPLWP